MTLNERQIGDTTVKLERFPRALRVTVKQAGRRSEIIHYTPSDEAGARACYNGHVTYLEARLADGE